MQLDYRIDWTNSKILKIEANHFKRLDYRSLVY